MSHTGPGRPKKPTALKELHGTARPDRLNPREPVLPGRLPDRPPWVDDDPMTGDLFNQVTKYVDAMRVSTEVDGIALSLLADQLATYLTLRERVHTDGPTVTVSTKDSSQIRVNPALREMGTVFNNILKLLREYGLTAASRANVSALAEETGTTFEEFLQNTGDGNGG